MKVLREAELMLLPVMVWCLTSNTVTREAGAMLWPRMVLCFSSFRMWRSQCNVGPSHLVYLAFETDYFNLDQILHHGALRVAGEKVFRRTRLYFRVSRCST